MFSNRASKLTHGVSDVTESDTFQELGEAVIVPVTFALLVLGGLGLEALEFGEELLDLGQHLAVDDIAGCVVDTLEEVGEFETGESKTSLLAELLGLAGDEFL